ncbi:MAG: deoxyuridine 5'-triphosphate nucleotidohydrolase, partial [Theionarchaea archaeon]|nr:deoxyuridine 5'-triphosphate nucleotidohydrolase [Theionarchaea archaeon]
MILNDEDLYQLCKTGMIENICDPSKQVTPNGIDLTLKKVEKFTGSGSIDFTNEKRK